ncbi:MAG: hypothetical protein LBJ10_01130, partial [Clostridiales bacterium]|nr:hypothetical protein [Clostridiales bacterium]
MVKREIVKSAIAHRETAGIPYCVSFTPEAEKLVRPYFPGEDMQLAIGNYVYQISPPWWDWVNLPPSYQEFGAPDCLPQTCGTGSYDSFYRQCGRIRETTDCYILATVWGSHFEKAYFARGIENFLADLIENQDFARELLDMIIRKNMVMLENIVSCEHVDGVLLGSDWGSQKSLIMSPRVWREFIKPGELREYGLLKAYGKDVWIHSCGNVDAILPDLVEMGVDVLNP